MAEELEIKLTLGNGGEQAVLDWLAGQGGAEPGRKHLVNRYYDTLDQALNGERAALRVRQADTHYIQTLKTQGHFVDGAHRREEWEWPLPGPDLNLGLLADTPVAERVNLAALAVVFETNFDRRIQMLDSEQASVECALDIGRILAGDRHRPLAEVEFELKSGSSSALLAWAERLAQRVPLFLNLVSKAEQGYWLAGLGTPNAEAVGDDSLTAFLRALSVHWLTGEAGDALTRSLAGIRQDAAEAGLEAEWRWLEGALKQPAREWLFEPGLIRLQLGLLARQVAVG
ncbi:CYTH domain-containing protein [Marinobacter bohaiensis]|uniref:CYTH domain-containing protein n=1 Tax=Marinobacter bohaiensis TaxID=2201898 RepID=UPI000DAD653B|nr:CYTH domain-containing protein [Marinobacter bohaiensis]